MFDLSLLPNRPEAFFGLKEDQSYDRRDLKRAYGKAIRVYKPDTNAAEFGQVREAYERLEKALRYGRQREQSQQAAQAWQPSPVAESPHTPVVPDNPTAKAKSSKTPTSKPKLTLQQLAVMDPKAALHHLQSKQRHNPQDYYLTAVLVDALNGKATERYLAPLLQGLATFPNDPGLLALATEFLRTEVADPMLIKIIKFVADKIRTPMFYQLTEPLWTRLSQTLSFAEVSELLTTCESKLHQNSTETRSVFYLQLLKSLIWTAPPTWIQQTLSELELRSADLDYQSQSDLEFLSELHALIRVTEGRSDRDPVRTKLLQAVRLDCQNDGGRRTAEVLQILSELSGDAEAMQTAFPLPGEDSDKDWVYLIYRLVFQLQNYLDGPEPASPQRLATQISHLLHDVAPTVLKLEQAANRGEIRYHWAPLAVSIFGVTIGGLLLGIMLSMLLPAGMQEGFIVIFAIGLFIASMDFFYRWLFPKFLKQRIVDLQHRGLMDAYQRNWRKRLFRFARGSNEPWETQLERVQTMANRSGHTNTGQTVLALARQDAGLAIFASLQTLLR